MRSILFLSFLVASLTATEPLSAQPIMDAFGRASTAEESRNSRQRISELERTTGLQASTIAGVAERLGLRYAGLSESQLFARLEAQLHVAVELKGELERLTEIIEKTADPTLRDQAETLVIQAQQAFSDGDFQKAEELFSELSIFREGISIDALDAYEVAISSQAKAAELQGGQADFDRADQIEANAAEIDLNRAVVRQLSRLDRNYRNGNNFGRVEGFEDAQTLYEMRIAPLLGSLESSELRNEAVSKKALGDADYASALGGEEGLRIIIGAQVLLENLAREQYQNDPSKMPISLSLAIVEVTTRRYNFDTLEALQNGYTDSLAPDVLNFLLQRYPLLSPPEERGEVEDKFYILFGEHILPLMDRLARNAFPVENGDENRAQWQLLSFIIRTNSMGSMGNRLERSNIETQPVHEAAPALIEFAKSYISVSNQCYPGDTSFALWGLCGTFFANEEQVKVIENSTVSGLFRLHERASSEGYVVLEADIQDLLGHVFYAISKRRNDDQSDFLLTRGLNVHNRAVLEFEAYTFRESVRTLVSIMQGFSLAAEHDISIACRYQFQREAVNTFLSSIDDQLPRSFSPAEVEEFDLAKVAYLEAENYVSC